MDGLKHVARQSLNFNMQFIQAVQTSVEKGEPLQNLYRLPELEDESKRQELEQKVDEALNRPTKTYDSHPSIQDRIRLAEQVAQPGSGSGNPSPAWDLIPGAEVLQMEMTRKVVIQVEKRG